MRIMLAGSLKTIGQDMAVDPEFAPDTIVRTKMQSVGQVRDFAIQTHMTMTTRPNEQFVIRRKAYACIKQAFNANEIRFAFPTVRVAVRWEHSSLPVSRARSAEYRDLARDLAAELEATLDRHAQ